MIRPAFDEWALQLARLVATRATCLRGQVGCVLVNARRHVLATGYNGVAAGLPHCNELVNDGYPHACAVAFERTGPSGAHLDGCEAVHAEQNAMVQCPDPWAIATAYVTHAPCVPCVKLLLGTGCQRIIFLTRAPHTARAEALWVNAGRAWALTNES